MNDQVGGAHAVALGDPFDGITLYGPFLDPGEATEWAEQNHGNEVWWVVPLNEPEDEA